MKISDMLANAGIMRLNDMQQSAVDAVRRGQDDVVILSPTGTGKTLAYLLPIAESIVPEKPTVQAVVIVPGRELAIQTADVLKSLRCGVRGMACFGGRMAMDEHRKLREVLPHIVFATPGRLLDHLEKGNIRPEDARFVVIDEFDKCLEIGFLGEMQAVMRHFPARSVRHVLLSATDAELIPRFVGIDSTRYIDFLDTDKIDHRVDFLVCHSPERDKLDTLQKLLRWRGEGSTIVFVNHRDAVERVASHLKSAGFVASPFHGGLDQRQREDAVYRFANGSATVLVATDLASRGLDIPAASCIIHYHLPDTRDNFLHRVGRTARWNATGCAIFLLGPDEKIPDFVDIPHTDMSLPDQLPAAAKPKMATIYIGKGKKDKLSRGDILGFLCKKGGLTPQEVGRIDVRERYCYAAISLPKLQQTLRNVAGEKVKGLKTVVEPVI